ncbi:HK97 gp10 family phage protein [Glutamicibacter sp. FBE19]|uniref:HK97 gp10 family phage protein n=1 Tax=Glutamicibacter sp. FBE19 TaxID=2761534 RepID=UPI0018964EEB|nr:HK97 gp10 family phage protein [Glutamicibacter sp. FBE19]MBF6672442.1 hypothetical protein [Glutamicibacter sp. FBE19]
MSGADELRAFAADLGKIASKALPDVDSVLKRGAQNIKDDLVSEAERSRTLGANLARSISYDSMYGIGHAKYEIGPDKSRPGGPLGNIYYFGTSRGGGTGDLDGPLDRETPNLERELGKLVDRWGGQLE